MIKNETNQTKNNMAHLTPITRQFTQGFPPVSRENSEGKEQVGSALPCTQRIHPNEKPDLSLPLPLKTDGESDTCVRS